MAGETVLDKLSIHIPQSEQGQNSVERLIKLGEKRDQSINYPSGAGDPRVPGEAGEDVGP